MTAQVYQEFLHFTDYLRFEKRSSSHTVRAYTDDLGQFKKYLEVTYEIGEISEATYVIIRSWVVSLMQEGMNPRSVNRKIATLKSYFRFLLREKKIKVNPMLKIQAPKTAKRLPVFVEQKKMDELLDKLQFPVGFEGERDRVVLEILYGTGMRLSELLALKHHDFNRENSTVKVFGKRSKERIIPVTPRLLEALLNYQKAVAKEFGSSGDGALILSKKGKVMGPRAVYNIVHHYLGEVTTLERRSPHILRHTYATHLLNNGADLNSIKELLGHANLSATQVYTHNSIEKLRDVYRKSHPKA